MANRPPNLRPNPADVFVAPGINPAAAAYAAGAAARAARKYAEPVGGSIHIPRLDGDHQEGVSMSVQAERVNSPPLSQLQQQLAPQSSIIEPSYPSAAATPTSGPQLRPQDTLPPQAQADPAFQHGYGAMFAVNQPLLAQKYGVVRDGRLVSPQELANRPLQPGQSGLRPETVAGLQQLQQLQHRAGLPATEAEADESQISEAAAASQNAGKPFDGPREEGDKKKVQDAIEAMDSFDYDALRQAMHKDMLNNEEQRKIIEGRCTPLDIEELILRNRVSQDVPVIPKKFIIRYTSMTGEDDLALKRLIMKESKSIEVTERYLLDKFAFMSLACGLTAINSNPVPTHLNEKGEFGETQFWLKFDWVIRKPLHLLASIGLNHSWFEMRVRKLFVAEKLGNG